MRAPSPTPDVRKDPPQQLPELRPITALPSVGEALDAKLARLRVKNVQDLLFLLPLRYEDRTRVVPIGSLRDGERAVIVIGFRQTSCASCTFHHCKQRSNICIVRRPMRVWNCCTAAIIRRKNDSRSKNYWRSI